MRNILVHGLGQTAASWDKVCEYFDAECDCPNLPKMIAGNPVSYLNLYREFVKYCGEFSEPLNICGLSLGGILALNYTIDFPNKVNSLVLIGTPYKSPKALLKLQNVVFRFMPNSAFNETGFGKREFIGLTKSMKNLDFSADLEKLSCRVMVIIGEMDKPNHKSAVEMAARIRGSEFKMVKDSGHEVNVDNPQELATLLSSFWK